MRGGFHHAATCHRTLWHWQSGVGPSESCTCDDAKYRALYGEPVHVTRIELRANEQCREYDADAGVWLPVQPKAVAS